MEILQLEDKGLSQYGYVLIADDKTGICIDPARDVAPILTALAERNATLAAICLTHPHADFVAGHAELSALTGAPIYVSKNMGAAFAHKGLVDGDQILLGEANLICLETPGHSPDSVCFLLSESNKPTALFSGDTLFIGDVGRPDLREAAGSQKLDRKALAGMLYRSTREKLLTLPDNVIVYPGHGAGSLCGKALSKANSSTIGLERLSNPALAEQTEEEFTAALLADLPFTPRYFSYDVELNRKGATALDAALAAIPNLERVPEDILLIDTRPAQQFRTGHLPGSINLQDGGKFETWLGSIVNPGEPFVLIVQTQALADKLLRRIAAIGYEPQVVGYIVEVSGILALQSPDNELDNFSLNPEAYTIVDIRNRGEVAGNVRFANAINIPLPELRERMAEIPTDKPIMVHCAAGYRSAAGSSILQGRVGGQPVYDLGEAINSYPPLVLAEA